MVFKMKLFAWKDTPLKEYIYTSLGMILLTTISVLILIGNLPPVVPFFYGKAVGENQLTNTLFLLVAPTTSLFILFLNTFLAAMTDNTFLKKVLIMCVFLFTLLMTITTFKVIFLVGFF